MDYYALTNAVRNGDIKKVQELLQTYEYPGITKSEALATAIKLRKIQIMKVLLEAKTKPTDVAIFQAIEFGTLEDLQSLIQWGGSINAIDCLLGTTLHAAAYNGKFDMIKYLVNSGVEQMPNGKTKWTPLHAVLYIENGFRVKEDLATRIAMFLIHKGADLNAKDSNGATPISCAIALENSYLVQTLIDLGAKFKEPGYHEAIFSSIKNKSSTRIFEILMQNGLDINQKYEHSSNHFTLLHLAVSVRNLNVIKILIGNGVNINEKNDKFQTPLHKIFDDKSSGKPQSKTLQELIRTEIAKILITHGADIESKNSKNYTIHHYIWPHSMVSLKLQSY